MSRLTPEARHAADATLTSRLTARVQAPMSVRQRLGTVVVALFAIAFTRAPGLIRRFNPLMRGLLARGVPAGPNVLLKVRGRRSGLLRAFPVTFLDLGDRAYVQAASADVAWVRNLQAAGEALIVKDGRTTAFDATELDSETAGRLLHDLLAPFPRSRLIRAVAGPLARPPLAVLRYFRLRVDDTPEECIAVARRQPVFELHRLASSSDELVAHARPNSPTDWLRGPDAPG